MVVVSHSYGGLSGGKDGGGKPVGQSKGVGRMPGDARALSVCSSE